MRKQKPPEPLTPLARRIDAAATQSGLTNEEIAERLHVTPGNVSHWRRGRHGPDPEQVQELAELFGVAYYPLLTGLADPSALMAAFQFAVERLREAILAGEDPAVAWERILGQSDLLTLEERLAFPSGPTGLRAYLASPQGLEWFPVTPQQHQAIRSLLAALGPPTVPHTTPDALPPPAETTE